MGGSDLIPLKGHTDRAVQQHRHVTGATNTYWLNELVRYVKAQGLWDNFRFYPMMPRTNFDSGSTVRGMGGLTSNDMTLVNGPTWGVGGIAFASASSQYGTIGDFLGSEALTVFARTSLAESSPTTRESIIAQYRASGANERSWYLVCEGAVTGDPVRLAISSDGTYGNSGFYNATDDVHTTSDQCLVGQWLADGTLSYWQNKTLRTLTLAGGSAQSSRFNASTPITFSCQDANIPAAFGSQTAHALAFVTGTLTTAQRETITDLINEL